MMDITTNLGRDRWRQCYLAAAVMSGTVMFMLPAEAKTIRITVVLPATGTEFGDRIRFGAEAAARVFGDAVKLKIAGPAQIDPAQEVKIFQSEASTLPDAIIVGPIPPSMFTEPALQAEDQGIAVAWLIAPPTPEVKDGLFVGTDDYEMGQAVGAAVAEHLKAAKPGGVTGQVLTGICIPGLSNLENRLSGIRATLAQQLPNVTLPNTMDTGNERGQNFAAWDQAVQAHPNALAMVDACEPGMINLTKIKQDEHRSFELDVFDTPEQVLSGLKKGFIATAVPPAHFLSGYVAVYIVADALLHGRKLPDGWLRTPVKEVNSGNIDAVIKSESSAAEMAAFYKQQIADMLAHMPARLPPLTALQH